jgi:predicted secreted protein
MFSYAIKMIAFYACLVCANSLLAQQLTSPPLLNVVQLSATGSVDVQLDLLAINMSTTWEGAEAAAVQTQLKVALDEALAQAKKSAQPGLLDVRTGNFSLLPRYGEDGKITVWQGSAELVLEGRDFARISAAAGEIQTLAVGNVSFALSREQRAKVEGEAQAQAIDRFKTKAVEIAKSFGFSGYTLREVSVNANDQSFLPRPRVMALQSRTASSEAPVPVEAGKTSVQVTVAGSVQLK